MKILAFVDIHGSQKALTRIAAIAKKADLLVCAGDITIFGQNLPHIIFQISKMGKLCLILHGNHESKEEMREACLGYKNVKFIHEKVVEVDGVVFLGYGGGGFSTRDEHFEKKTAKIFSGKEGRTVLVTHAPPFGTKLDKLMDGHCGSKSIMDFILHNSVRVHISGHIHENAGKIDKIGKTIFINPGPFGTLIKI